ncbi:MAG TPA: MFS transporter [Symbiobacteriaceae bacterium]|nr:MFS transporter [Symbiobacteriaceae bacterium]
MTTQPNRHATTALVLSTAALTVSFATWTLISPLAPTFQQLYGLTNLQTSMVIAAPVLLGSLGRIPLGALTDRYGGRAVFTAVMLLQALPLILAGLSTGYVSLLLAAVPLGIGGAAFAVGIPLVSRWFPPERHGLVLGIYGMGNIGTAVAAMLAPQIAALGTWRWVYFAFIPVVLIMGAILYTGVQNAPKLPGKAAAGVGVALRQPLAWLLSFWYFVTFGGFVAFGGYLPKLYVDLYHLTRGQAGTLASVFVLTATIFRPIGGWLSDRIGGKQAVTISLVGIAATASLLTLALPLAPFQLTMMAGGVFFGIGNGAVFKLVPQFFPTMTGSVTGLVGAMGGLGGFFPPLVMGALRDRLGTYTPAFVMLAIAAGLGWLLVGVLEEKPAPWNRPRQQEALLKIERAFASRAAMNAFIVTGLLMILIYVGTDQLHHFDPALYGYAVATVVAIIGMTIRITAWLMRPATRTLAKRFTQRLFMRVEKKPGVKNPVPEGVGRWFEGRRHPGGYIEARDRLEGPGAQGGHGRLGTPAKLPATKGADPGLQPEADRHPVPGTPGPAVAAGTLVNNILLNRFIFRRSLWRGLQHFLLMWGIFGSFAITIPLTFGWLHFEAVGETHYTVVAFGISLFTMPVHGVLAGLIYHGLSTFAVITLAGVSMMILRRLLDKDAKVDQRIEYDLFPLYLLLAVTVTGLALTVSHVWLMGWNYPTISIIHQITVVIMLLYLPFGKLFHIPMRSFSVAADVYHEVGAHEGLAACVRCQKAFATRQQLRDVIAVLKESGMALMAPDGQTYLAEYCPECRRVLRGLIYSRRPLRPEEAGASRPLMQEMPEGGPPLHV